MTKLDLQVMARCGNSETIRMKFIIIFILGFLIGWFVFEIQAPSCSDGRPGEVVACIR